MHYNYKLLPTLLLLAAFFYSCKSVEKQRRNAAEFYQTHPAELAEVCADRFPPKVEYKKGDSILVKGDTVYLKGDSLVCPDIPATPTQPAGKGKVLKCPESKVVTNTIRITDTITVENTARVNSVLYRLQTVSADLDKTKIELGEANKRRRTNLLTWIILAIVAAALAFFNVKNKVGWKI